MLHSHIHPLSSDVLCSRYCVPVQSSGTCLHTFNTVGDDVHGRVSTVQSETIFGEPEYTNVHTHGSLWAINYRLGPCHACKQLNMCLRVFPAQARF